MSGGQVPISAVRIGSFRTLRDVEFRATGQITVVCGPNNSGKSSLLDALEAYTAIHNSLARGDRRPGEQIDDGLVNDLIDGGLAIGLDLTDPTLVELLDQQVQEHHRRHLQLLPDALVSELADESGLWWVQVESANGRSPNVVANENPTKALRTLVDGWANGTQEQRIWSRATNALSPQNSRVTGEWFSRVFRTLLEQADLRRIGDVRRSGASPLSDNQLGELARAAAPTAEPQPRKREKWARQLERVLQDVFGEDVHYQATHAPNANAGNELRLSIDGETDVLVENLGAGVREVVAVAFSALSGSGPTVLCIEEPENCLHPTAARRLIQSLARRTEVQLIVSTHSASVVNSNPHTVINVERRGTTSTCRTVADARARFRAVTQLGHSPADLVLAYCSLWVEGPSDRLYLKAWLENVHGLEEGIDYSMMFYGGALGANVGISSDPDDEQLFAEIRPLCRRTAVVADSDQDRAGAKRKKHVLRWLEEAKDDPDALVLTTPFREVENCLPLEVANRRLKAKNLKAIKQEDYRYARVIVDSEKTPKVPFARQAIADGGDRPGEHAARMVEQLAQFIRQSRVH